MTDTNLHPAGALGPPADLISLLVSDVDGTLVTPEKELTAATVAAVTRLRPAGIRFALISSRPPRGLAMLTGPLGITTFLAGFNGGALATPDLQVIEEKRLPVGVAAATMEVLAAHGVDAWLFSGNEWVIATPAQPYIALERRTVQFSPTLVDGFAAYLDRAQKITGVSGDFARLDACEAALRAALGGSASAARGQRYYLDVTHLDANKGHGVRAIARRLGVPLAEVATIGDMANDLPMFAVGGLAVAMGNAPPDVQAAAHFVAGPNTADGFAAAVDRFILPRAKGG